MDTRFAAQLASVRGYVDFMAGTAETSSLYERDGIAASICPAAPAQAMANVVSYSDPTALLSGLSGVEAAYEAAGVSAWQLWDWGKTERAELEAAGYQYIGHMPGMAIELENLAPVEPEFEWIWHQDVSVVGRVNEAAYENGDGLAAAVSKVPAGMSVRVYEAPWQGETGAAVCMVHPPDSDDLIGYFLATHPDARGKGLGTKLYVSALLDGRERGYKTSSLQASPVGAPIYPRLGFEPVSDALFEVYEWSGRGSA